MKIKIMSFAVAVILLFSCSVVGFAEEDSAKIIISADVMPTQVGDTVTVTVGLDSMTANRYFASDIAMYFNPTVLKPLSAPEMSSVLTESEKFVKIYDKTEETKGLVRCAIGMKPEEYSESGFPVSTGKLALFTVTFEVIGQGNMNLQIAEQDSAPVYDDTLETGAELYLGEALQTASFRCEGISSVIGEEGERLISEILSMDAIAVPYGTENIQAVLPESVSVRLDDLTVEPFEMKWTEYLSAYDPFTPGVYLFRGELQEKDGYRNHLNLFSLLEVTVLPQENSDENETGGQPGSDGEKTDGEKNDGQEPEKLLFSDLESVPWAADKIVSLAKEGIVSGISEGIYEPTGNVTRAQFAAMLTRAFGLLDESAVCEFSDVAPGEWHYSAIASAYTCGILTGYGDGTCRPDALITRQEMAAMAYRTAEKKGLTIPQTAEKMTFEDEDTIADYAKEAISVMQQGEIINGMGDGRFCPAENATRAQAAVVIYQLYDLN